MGMGMGMRLGVHQEGGLDYSTVAYAEGMTALGGNPTDISTAGWTAINKFITTLKNANLFTAIFDCLYLFALPSASGTGGRINSLVNMVNPGTYDLVRLTSGAEITSWTAKKGWYGTTGKALESYQPNGTTTKFKSNNAMMTCFAIGDNNSATQTMIGHVSVGTNNYHDLMPSSGNFKYSRIGGSVLIGEALNTNANSLTTIERISATNLSIFSDGQAVATSTTNISTHTLPAGKLYITAFNIDGTISSPYLGTEIGLAGMGAPLGIYASTANHTLISNAIKTYLSDIASL